MLKRAKKNPIHPLTLALSLLFLNPGCKNEKVIPVPASLQNLDTQTIAEISGLKNFSQKSTVFATHWSRADWETIVDRVAITSDFGFNSEFSIQGTNEKTTLLGDLRVPQIQMQAVLKSVLAQGFEVQSLHNTFLDDQPRVQSLHLISSGSATQVAEQLKNLVENLNALPRLKNKVDQAQKKNRKGALDPLMMQKILWAGEWKNNIYRVERGRGTNLNGVSLGGSTGVKSWAAFQGNESQAVVTGDVATIQADLNDILKVLTEAGIKIVSIHTHFNEESPRLVFVHFWGDGPIQLLANAFNEAVVVNESHQSN